MSFVRQVATAGRSGIDYVAHGADWAELSLPYDEKLIGMRESGVIASGPIISLMDMATSIAIWVKLERFRHQATLDLRVDYLRPAPGREDGDRARRMLWGDAQHRVRCAARRMTGTRPDPVAHVTGTFMFTD
jgi:uncharacterized protein (TIGR00369 family)